MHFNIVHVIVAFVILAGMDCALTFIALKNATGLKEANPVMAFLMQKLGVPMALLVSHYVPLAIALWLVHHGNLNGWGFIIDGIAFFGLVDIWDAYQLHRAGKL